MSKNEPCFMRMPVKQTALALRHPIEEHAQRKPAAQTPTLPDKAPTTHRLCACGGTCPRCAGSTNSLSAQKSSSVRIHASAPEVTTPLRARAVTIGQDIYFHPGQYQPGTPEGESLIAHELAHTLQTRQSASSGTHDASGVSQKGDAIEHNADALARGDTIDVLAAPAGMALRSPLDSEGADDRARRHELLQAISNAQANLIRLLQTGGLVEGLETAAERGGVRGVIINPGGTAPDAEPLESYAVRDARLRRIIRNLAAMGALYRTAPIPASLPPAQLGEYGQFTTEIQPDEHTLSHYGGSTAAWAQLQAAYELYRFSEGQTGDAYESDWYYLTPDLRINPGAARGAPRIGRGTPSGAYMVVPDIDNEPLRYWYLDGYAPIPRGSTIVEFWHDDLGYYYEHRGQRIDVPSPWSRD